MADTDAERRTSPALGIWVGLQAGAYTDPAAVYGAEATQQSVKVWLLASSTQPQVAEELVPSIEASLPNAETCAAAEGQAAAHPPASPNRGRSTSPYRRSPAGAPQPPQHVVVV